jgi:hypothetical protein
MVEQTEKFAIQIAQFISTSRASKKIWGLRAEDGWLSCEAQQQDKEVMPFWSTQELAAAHAIDEWSEFSVVEIPLDIFVEDWLVTLKEDDVLVGIEWDENLNGAELTAEQVSQRYKLN